MIAVAVTVLVIEPIWKSVSPSTGSGCSTLVTPKPCSHSSPSAMSPTATPGTASSRQIASTASPCSVAGPCVVMRSRPRVAPCSWLARGLREADVVAEWVTQAGVDAVRALRGLVGELDALRLELRVGLPGVVGDEEEVTARSSLGHE